MISPRFASEWRPPIVILMAFTFAIRWVYSVKVELLPEEAYYWNYSRHLDIGYLDHPPLVAWLIRSGTFFFGNTEFGVRSAALCCGLVTAFFVYRLTRNAFDEATALLALAMTQVLPFFFLSGVLMTPDAPLTAAWAASLYFLERALITGRTRAWLGLGLAIGIGMISKYSIALLAAAGGVFLIVDAPSRRWLRRWQPYAAVAVAVAVFLPVIVWNAQNDWASFAFQTSRRLAEAPRFSSHKLIGAALVLLTPVGLIAALMALTRPSGGNRASRLLRIAVVTALVVFGVFSLRHEVKLDWTGAPWTAVLPLMAAELAAAYRGAAGARSWLRSAWPATAAVMLLVYCAGLFYLILGIPGIGYSRHTELVPLEWRTFARQVDAIADSLRVGGAELRVVGMDRYAIASELAFYSGDQSRSVAETTSAHLFDGVGLMYERWFPLRAQVGHRLLLVSFDPEALTEKTLEGRAEGLLPIQEGLLTRNGHLIRPYYYRTARDFKYP